jgi:DNA invertase Pin-like site-specific DNA recombinase
MCCLCGECHSKLHFGRNRGNISAATKAGLERARNRGVQLGCKPGTTFTTKKSAVSKATIIKNSKDFSGELDDGEVLQLCGISRNSYYKYKRELKAEKAADVDIVHKYITDKGKKEKDNSNLSSIGHRHNFRRDEFLI